MVDAQHRLVVEHLKLTRLHAVVGISMGGMQALEWAVRYPGFVDAVVPISGTPQAAFYDRLLWTALLSEIDNGRARGASADSVWTQLAAATRQDVAASFGGDLSRAAAQVRARMLIIYSWDDHTVTAGPSAAFARLAHADTLSVPSACGQPVTTPRSTPASSCTTTTWGIIRRTSRSWVARRTWPTYSRRGLVAARHSRP